MGDFAEATAYEMLAAVAERHAARAAMVAGEERLTFALPQELRRDLRARNA